MSERHQGPFLADREAQTAWRVFLRRPSAAALRPRGPLRAVAWQRRRPLGVGVTSALQGGGATERAGSSVNQ